MSNYTSSSSAGARDAAGTAEQGTAADSRGSDSRKRKNVFAPLVGKRFDEISPDDLTAVIQNIIALLPKIKLILFGTAAGFMALKAVRLLRLYMRRQELGRIMEENGLNPSELKPGKAARILQKKRYRRYRRNRKILNILAPKKTRKSSGYHTFIAVMDQLHPKKGC